MNKKLQINTSPSYEVIIYERTGDAVGNAKAIAEEISAISDGKSEDMRYCIFADETCWKLYSGILEAGLNQAGLQYDSFVFPAGEETKSIDRFSDALEFLASQHYTRKDMLIAFGGGVIGDLTGFVAASFLRGIKYVQVPTTLLACVDSSVGGKTAINLAAGKNLAGAFHQPSKVLISENFLDTLPDEIFLAGMAEVIKCGAIGDVELFNLLHSMEDLEECRKTKNLTKMIVSSISLKKRLVEEDEKDTGSRQLLNLGHTLGHALEMASDHKIMHGFAVASGMYLCAKAADALKLTKNPVADVFAQLLGKFGYPLTYDYSAETLLKYILSDKKRSGNSINLVIPEEIGAAALHKIPVGELEEFIKLALA